MTRILARLWSSDRAASAAEFALVLPLLILFLLGIIDTGRFMYEYNQAEKATQMGARFAVSTDVVAPGLASYSFSVDGGVPQGNAVPVANFTSATCTNASCSCVATTGNFCSSVGYNAAAFANVANRMAFMYPPIRPANVSVEYRNIGLGFAGDPNGPDVAPLVTVRLTNMNFQPLTMMLLKRTVSMPEFAASLTLEDGAGTQAN
jgi:hypothetical protein